MEDILFKNRTSHDKKRLRCDMSDFCHMTNPGQFQQKNLITTSPHTHNYKYIKNVQLIRKIVVEQANEK
jgi:hypothetical protein